MASISIKARFFFLNDNQCKVLVQSEDFSLQRARDFCTDLAGSQAINDIYEDTLKCL